MGTALIPRIPPWASIQIAAFTGILSMYLAMLIKLSAVSMVAAQCVDAAQDDGEAMREL